MEESGTRINWKKRQYYRKGGFEIVDQATGGSMDGRVRVLKSLRSTPEQSGMWPRE